MFKIRCINGVLSNTNNVLARYVGEIDEEDTMGHPALGMLRRRGR